MWKKGKWMYVCICIYLLVKTKHFWKDTQGTGNIVASSEGSCEAGRWEGKFSPSINLCTVNFESCQYIIYFKEWMKQFICTEKFLWGNRAEWLTRWYYRYYNFFPFILFCVFQVWIVCLYYLYSLRVGRKEGRVDSVGEDISKARWAPGPPPRKLQSQLLNPQTLGLHGDTVLPTTDNRLWPVPLWICDLPLLGATFGQSDNQAYVREL